MESRQRKKKIGSKKNSKPLFKVSYDPATVCLPNLENVCKEISFCGPYIQTASKDISDSNKK